MSDPRDTGPSDDGAAEGDPAGGAAPDDGLATAGDPSDGLDDALKVAEATLARKPEIDYLLVADRAEVVSGKLYLMGGSWDRLSPARFPHHMLLGLALGVRIPFAHTDDQHTVAIELQLDGTRLVGFEARLTTGRPPGMAGMDMLVPMAFNVPLSVPSAGQLVLRAAVDGRPPRRHEIRVIQRPPRAS